MTGDTPSPLDQIRQAMWDPRCTVTGDAHPSYRSGLAALAQVEALITAADELRLWEPGRKGYAAAQDRLFDVLARFDT